MAQIAMAELALAQTKAQEIGERVEVLLAFKLACAEMLLSAGFPRLGRFAVREPHFDDDEAL